MSLDFFTTVRERRTVKEMKQRGVGRPLLRIEFESEMLKFFREEIGVEDEGSQTEEQYSR